ncbi:hypothetical protein ACVWYH_008936 [Bradyrhizobium sp. GM24.11]
MLGDVGTFANPYRYGWGIRAITSECDGPGDGPYRVKMRLAPVAPSRHPDHIARMTKKPFRLTPYQVQFLIVVGFITVGWALYVRYLAIEFSQVALACDAGLQTMICKARSVSTSLFKNSVFGIVALVIATLNLMRPSIVLLTLGVVAAGLGIVLYNIVLSGLAIGLLILGFARPAPATA